MLTYHHVSIATRIGMLTRERDPASACGAALSMLGGAIRHDAATLIALDPISRAHVQLAGVEYTRSTSEALAVEFLRTPWYRNVMRQRLPPSISAEAGQSFRRGWFYEQYVHPAGYRDGITGALRHRDRYVGLIHLSTARPGVYDVEARQVLAAMLPALGALADLNERVRGLDDLTADDAAALVARAGVVDLPGRDRPAMLADEEFRALLREFAGAGVDRFSLVWRAERTWHRVGLVRQPAAGWPGPDAVLVHARPTHPPYELSPRELDVLTRIAMGQPNQAIACGLFVSPRTVHSHIEHILRKTGCSSRAEAAALAVREHLLRPTPVSSGGGGLGSLLPEGAPLGP